MREDLDLDLLTGAELDAAVRLRDETAEDVSGFINTVLKPPQRRQMRRSIIYRTAGLCAPVVERFQAEGFSGINQRQVPVPQSTLQRDLFTRCDEEIDRLRNAFPDDAFLSNKQRVGKGLGKINLMRIVGG